LSAQIITSEGANFFQKRRNLPGNSYQALPGENKIKLRKVAVSDGGLLFTFKEVGKLAWFAVSIFTVIQTINSKNKSETS